MSLLDLDRTALIWTNSRHNALLDAMLAPIAHAGGRGAILGIAAGPAAVAVDRRLSRRDKARSE